MKLNKQVATALLAGVALASASGVIAKPNAQLKLSAEAPEGVQTEFSSWQEGKRLSGRKDKCYGIRLRDRSEPNPKRMSVSHLKQAPRCAVHEAENGQ